MKYNIASYLPFLLAWLLVVSSCQNRPKEVLNRKEMEQLLYDVYLAEATIENEYQLFNSAEKKEAYINRLFASHGVTPAEWDSSLSWYSDRIDLYLQMNDSVKARLERARKVTDAEISRMAARKILDPRTLSPSYIPPHYSFTSSAAMRGFNFRLMESELNARITDDQFSFSYNVIGIPPNFSNRLSSRLTLEYGDTTIYLPQMITENKTYRVTAMKYLPGDSINEIQEDTLKRIYGYLHLHDSLQWNTLIQLHDIRLGSVGADSARNPQTQVEDRVPRDRVRLLNDSLVAR
ncbi:DUF4296 domain-containing protein [Dysgonomonadaceae bacterium zrk40]|nr:DUF4296 domain-containing protein [Dysgonomonadaceae bacterium zrk40]